MYKVYIRDEVYVLRKVPHIFFRGLGMGFGWAVEDAEAVRYGCLGKQCVRPYSYRRPKRSPLNFHLHADGKGVQAIKAMSLKPSDPDVSLKFQYLTYLLVEVDGNSSLYYFYLHGAVSSLH